jgi:hypothetical protein
MINLSNQLNLTTSNLPNVQSCNLINNNLNKNLSNIQPNNTTFKSENNLNKDLWNQLNLTTSESFLLTNFCYHFYYDN